MEQRRARRDPQLSIRAIGEVAQEREPEPHVPTRSPARNPRIERDLERLAVVGEPRLELGVTLQAGEDADAGVGEGHFDGACRGLEARRAEPGRGAAGVLDDVGRELLGHEAQSANRTRADAADRLLEVVA